METRGKYKGRKENPPNPDGRPLTYEEPKKRRNLSVTQAGWEEVQAIAEQYDLSVSNLLSIAYAFRPRLRSRLTLSGRAFLRKP